MTRRLYSILADIACTGAAVLWMIGSAAATNEARRRRCAKR